MDSYTPSLADLEARLAKWEWDKVRMLRNWIVKHQRVAAWFLLLPAGINGWICHSIKPAHPYMALLLAAESSFLVLGVYLTYGSISGPGPRPEP
jgi:hypothetical protein